jgi:hypothetical protein
MSHKLKPFLLALLAVVLLAGAGQAQRGLNRDRDRLGLTRVTPLENAPPVLAFTTVALGGFRGLISNALWMRMNDLQDQDKFFEMVQLADWITKLEPHFAQVWVNQAWNMSYNISVKFKDFADRWRWVQRGIELVRDEGLKYNPNEILLYRELAWHFQHKMGQDMDDANRYYKQQWANQMATVFGKKTPNLDEFLNPTTDDARARLTLLTNKFKMDPKFMKEVDERYGPLEWRLPEAHSIYWAAAGLKRAEANPTKVNPDDLLTLRRAIYQSMLLSFHRGRMVANLHAKRFEMAPNLALIPKVNAAYEESMADDAKNRDHIAKAHRNFLRDAVYFLYGYNRMAEAARWYKYLADKYPNQNVLSDPASIPSKVPFDEYAVARLQEDIGETDFKRVTSALEGLLVSSFTNLALDEDDRAAGFKLMARKIYDRYEAKTKISKERVGLAPFGDLEKEALRRVLDSEQGLPLEARAIIRTKLGMGAEPPRPEPSPTAAPASGTATNSPAATVTNTPAAK